MTSGVESQKLFERQQKVIPWGSSTISKAATFLPDEPGVIVRGKGCHVWDADGREFIDFRNGLGPITLGYCFPAVDEAVRKQLDCGITFGHPHPLEGEVAEMLCEIIPCAEQARFLKTGGEAIAACIRLARFYTGRSHVIQVGYNGWLNSLSPTGQILPGRTSNESTPGVPEALSLLHHGCEWGNIEKLRSLFERFEGQIAALVVAAAYPDMEKGSTFYPELRQLTHQQGTVLIFDEIVTGFRIARAGVQEYFNVVPDMAVFAKGMANGMPISAYMGRRELMEHFKQVTVSSTYGGETLSLAAARATLGIYRDEDVIGHLWKMGERLKNEGNLLFERYELPIRFVGMSPCFIFQFQPPQGIPLREAFFRSAYRNGLSFYNMVYVNFSHTGRDIDQTVDRLEKVCKDIA